MPRNIARLLGRLDAIRHTVVVLRVHENKQLMVRGGAGKFLVCARDGAKECFYLTSGNSPDAGTAIVVIGGRSEEIPADGILDKQLALSCALTYLYTGTRDPDFIWRATSLELMDSAVPTFDARVCIDEVRVESEYLGAGGTAPAACPEQLRLAY